MVRLGQLLEGDIVLRRNLRRIVALAVERQGHAWPEDAGADTTVVETPIRYPSDSRLCEDVTQVVCREIEHVRSEGVAAPLGFRNVQRPPLTLASLHLCVPNTQSGVTPNSARCGGPVDACSPSRAAQSGRVRKR